MKAASAPAWSRPRPHRRAPLDRRSLFLRLRDRTGEIQLLVSEAVLGADYARLADLDVGDIVEAEGAITASKRGELSIEPKRVRLVTKSFRPLPEKWHGLTDVETRYRQLLIGHRRQP
ncbi:MAG: OB-fold nucleic acid binding domain-containing protein [Polyangiaceae bacterium]